MQQEILSQKNRTNKIFKNLKKEEQINVLLFFLGKRINFKIYSFLPLKKHLPCLEENVFSVIYFGYMAFIIPEITSQYYPHKKYFFLHQVKNYFD